MISATIKSYIAQIGEWQITNQEKDVALNKAEDTKM